MVETPRYGHPPIEMHQVYEKAQVSSLEHDWFDPEDKMTKRGDYYYLTHPDGTKMICIAIPCNTADGWTYSHWEIDGPRKRWAFTDVGGKISMTPSLHAIGVWHGFVTDGQLVEA